MSRLMALQTDSTRFMTLHADASGKRIPLPVVDQGYHQLTPQQQSSLA